MDSLKPEFDKECLSSKKAVNNSEKEKQEKMEQKEKEKQEKKELKEKEEKEKMEQKEKEKMEQKEKEEKERLELEKYEEENEIIVPSKRQTKDWRKNREWYKGGKSNECEIYQKNLIEEMLSIKLEKTDDRINIETNQIIDKKSPMINDDGFEYTENFDGKIVSNNTYYFNLKFVCDAGGAQTRTLREVYHFIRYQLEYIIKFNTSNIYFINILDGDTSYNNMNKFIYLINKEEYNHVKKYVFIGDLYNFEKSEIKLQITSK